MNKCPIESCGRTFESHAVLEQHLKRRHPKFLSQTANSQPGNPTQDCMSMSEEVKKLPKIRQLKPQSREKRQGEAFKKSLSKGKSEFSTTTNASKVTAIISDSRNYLEKSQLTSKTAKRPSLSKKNSSSDLLPNKSQKLPEIKGTRLKKLELLDSHKPSSFQEKDLLYSTAPNFKRFEAKQSGLGERIKSKEKMNSSYLQEEETKIKKISAAEELAFVKTQQGFREKETKIHSHRPLLKKPLEREREKGSEKALQNKQQTEVTQKSKEETAAVGEKGVKQHRKELKAKIALRRDSSLKKGEAKQLNQSYNFDEKIVVLKSDIGSRLTVPPTAKCEFVFANNCALTSVNLNNLQTLRELSLQHNNLKDLSFLNYTNSQSIQKLFVDHNQIGFLDYLPPNLRILSATFNLIQGLQTNSRELNRLPSLQEVDFSFNGIRKEGNYRLHIISCCPNLKKIDGIKITKFDLEMAAQYVRLLDQQLGLVPSSKVRDLVVSKCSNSPSTVISVDNETQQEMGLSYEQLQREIAKLSKTSRQTKEHLDIIKQENEAMRREIAELRSRETQEHRTDPTVLYDKLRAECEALELLNFLQYASEEELLELIASKQSQ